MVGDDQVWPMDGGDAGISAKTKGMPRSGNHHVAAGESPPRKKRIVVRRGGPPHWRPPDDPTVVDWDKTD